MSDPVYPTCSIKRIRRTKDNLQGILHGCWDVIKEERRVTLRHLFYRVVSLGLIAKTETEYAKLSGYTMKWRREGSIPWSSFVDSTRWYHGVRTFDNLSAALENSKKCYRRNLWQSQKVYVELWTEKEAIAAIVQEAAEPFGVPVFPMKGFGSGSALHSIAQQIRYQQSHGKSVYVYHLGDHDPSGRCIDESTVRNLREDHGVEFTFKRIAVTPEQIKQYSLLTRPTKRTDPRAGSFEGESVEVDALAPHVIRELVENAITQHIDTTVWEREKKIEDMESESLSHLIDSFDEDDVDDFNEDDYDEEGKEI